MTSSVILSAMMAAFAMTPAKAIDTRTNAVACVAAAVYYEAANQPEEGQYAIAHVIKNRMDDDAFPNNGCRVVRQPYQFSFINPESKQAFKNMKVDKDAWHKAVGIAGQVLSETVQDNTRGSIFYCNEKRAKADWCKASTPVVEYKDHKYVTRDGFKSQ